MPKLTDSQLVILSAAAQRLGGTALPLPKSLRIKSAVVTKTLQGLRKKGLLEERPAAPDTESWRETEDGRHMRRRYFCLEVDRGTMPVVRSNPYQTSYLRKMLAYSHTHARDVLYREFGIERFQVLTLTTSQERIRTMQDAYREHVPRELRRPNLFLFTELSKIDLDTDVFALTWQNANGKPAKLPL